MPGHPTYPAAADRLARRPRCPVCALPLATCLCALVVPVANEIDLLVLQHPHEADEAKGSVRLLAACLARCRVLVGAVFDTQSLAHQLHGDGRRSALLYPATESLPSGTTDAIPSVRPTQLVLLDGTWRKSLRMLAENPLLQALPRQALPPGWPARYAPLRKARRPGQLSSLEAGCLALGTLEEAPLRYVPLLDAFEHFVDAQLARAGRARKIAAGP